MARIFNIYFAHLGRSYNAIVSVRSTGLHTEYTLNQFSEELMQLLPGNKIVSYAPGEFSFQHATSQHSEGLMNTVIGAVREHMNGLVNS